ncbi:TetR/AcrR family transcriptional regulator [Variovorax gossypii]|uniref:TetR/AcrR family transcriptional regulator n=2 Tax=Variovorax gossypii TaxID=1679495 RepID=A0A431TTF8_9BURK|nr:TetR/AcrR family transcriptional regulator [Variovorax gossypii]
METLSDFIVSTVNIGASSMSTSYHHGDLKAVLLAYAREQMERDSLDGLSMREMAKAVGVSHTAAYRHFQDKRALMEAVALQGFEEMLAGCESAIAAVLSAESRSRLKACGRAYVGFGLKSPRLLVHMFGAVSQSQSNESLVQAGARLFHLLLGLVGAGQADGTFRQGDARQLSHTCWAMVHGLSTLLGVGVLRAPTAELEALHLSAEQALDVLLDGMAATAAPR